MELISIKKKPEHQLSNLAAQMRESGVNTNVELLKDSRTCAGRLPRIRLNDKKMPYLFQEKYIVVPTYNHRNDPIATSVRQEHVLGTKEYVLSLGTPRKAFQPVLAKASI